MSRFLTPLITEVASDSADRLMADLVFVSDEAGIINVPAGFETDYASVPRIPLAYMLFGGVAKKAAVVHDYLYSTKMLGRDMADAVFLDAMEASGVAWWRRRLMYRAVRVFGWTIYNKEATA